MNGRGGALGGFQPRMTPAVRALLIAISLCFVAQLSLNQFAGIPTEVLFGFSPPSFLSGRVWQLVTYPFLHGSIGHIVMNGLMLYMLGTELEARWGSLSFLKFFGITATGGALLQTLIWLVARLAGSSAESLSAPIIGASGALYGLFMAFAMLYGNTQVLVFFVVPMKVRNFVAALAAIDIISAVFYSSSGVAHLVHLGGLVTGWLYLRWKGPDLRGRGGGFFGRRRVMGREELKRRMSVITNTDREDPSKKSKYPVTWN